MCFGVTQDGGKSFGRDFKITRLFWTSDAVSACTQVKMKDAPVIFIFPKNMFQRFGSDYRAHEDPNIGNQLTIQFLPLERNLHGHPLAGLP